MSRFDDIQQAATGLAQLSLYLRTRQWKAGEAMGPDAHPDHRPDPAQATGIQPGQGPWPSCSEFPWPLPAASSRLWNASSLSEKPSIRRTAGPHWCPWLRAGLRVVSTRTEFPEGLLSALAGLSPLESRALHTALSKVILELQESGAIEPQRMCCTCRFFRPYRHLEESRPHHCDFVDASFGTASLRLDCGDHQPAEETVRKQRWRRFLAATPPD